MIDLKKIKDFIGKTIRSDIQETVAYKVNNARNLIKLDAMESPYSLPEKINEKIAKKIKSLSLNRYPEIDRTKLVKTVKDNFEIPHDADVLFGNGSDELIHLIIQSCCSPGDVVLSPSPSFVYFEMAAKFNNAKFVNVMLDEELQIDLQKMLDAISINQPKVIFLAMPNNPTGGLWDKDIVKKIIENAPGLVIIDEAYKAFTDYTWMSEVMNFPNILVLRTVSKIGLAGLRFGYLSGHPDWIAQIDKIRPPYNINVLTEQVFLTIMENKDILDQQTRQILIDREILLSELKKINELKVFPSNGNFILVKVCSDNINANDIYEKLKKEGVLIKNLSHSHQLLENCLRISVGTSQENSKLLDILKETFIK